MAGIPLDEVIQLQHASAKPQETTPNVRLVRYMKTEDILPLLNASHIARLSLSPVDNQGSSAPSSSEGKPRGEANRTKATANDQGEETDAVADPIQSEFTEEHHAAKVVVLKTYRAYIQRKAAEKDPLTEMRRRIYKDFLAKSPTIKWGGSPYRFLFLGMVPHLFAVTESLKDHMHQVKSAAKESLHSVHNSELETVQAAIDNAS